MESSLSRPAARFVAIAGVLLALAAAFGAIGSHLLRGRLEPARLDAFELAVAYQFYHGVGVLAAAWLCERLPQERAPLIAGWLFIAGIAAFCGSICARAFGAPPLPVPVAPAGGLAFIAGWLALAWAGIRALRR